MALKKFIVDIIAAFWIWGKNHKYLVTRFFIMFRVRVWDDPLRFRYALDLELELWFDLRGFRFPRRSSETVLYKFSCFWMSGFIINHYHLDFGKEPPM